MTAREERCWVCGETITDCHDFEGDGYHSPCVAQARRIEAGLQPKRPAAITDVDVATVRW